MQIPSVVVLPIALVALCGCGQDPGLQEVLQDQREILYKLGGLEKTLQLAANRPAGLAPNVVDDDKVYPDRIYTIPLGDSAVKGSRDARVTVVEFSDFQCPPCGDSRGLLERVLETYPKDVKLVYKVFPLSSIHPFALGAARAAIAAGRQGKFWEMHDVMYQNQTELAPDKLTQYAKSIGLDVERWQRDMVSPEVQAQVAREIGDGRAADVDATPTIFVNGRRMGQRSMDDFKQAIDAVLRKG